MAILDTGCVVVGWDIVAPAAVIDVTIAKRDPGAVCVTGRIVVAWVVVTDAALVDGGRTGPDAGAVLLTDSSIGKQGGVIAGVVVTNAA